MFCEFKRFQGYTGKTFDESGKIIDVVSGGLIKVWEDNFDGHALNESNWRYEHGCGGWGNDELQCHTIGRQQNVRVENGKLIIHANVEPFNGKNYTSGRLASRKGWAYGRFEARAKLPKGIHLWPAIWLYPKDDSIYGGHPASGEIDIMESRGHINNQIEGSVHYGGDYPNFISKGSGDVTFPYDFSADYHIFALEWDQNEMRWYCDKKMFHREPINKNLWSGKGRNPYTKNGQPFDKPFFWVLNVAVGGKYSDTGEYPKLTIDDAKKWPKPTMEVDYVRVFKWDK